MARRRRGIIGFGLDDGAAIIGIGSGNKGGRLTRRRRHATGYPARWVGMLLPSGAVLGGGTRRRRRKGRRS